MTEHEELVLRFAKRLRKDGIDAQIDEYLASRPPSGWPRWIYWFQINLHPGLDGWVPKPSRAHQTRRYPALTAQIICVLSLAERDPNFSYINHWLAFVDIKNKFISGLTPNVSNLASLPDDQIEAQDQAVPPAIELEGRTFLAFPWILMACETLTKDSSLPAATQKKASLIAGRLEAVLPAFDKAFRP